MVIIQVIFGWPEQGVRSEFVHGMGCIQENYLYTGRTYIIVATLTPIVCYGGQ